MCKKSFRCSSSRYDIHLIKFVDIPLKSSVSQLEIVTADDLNQYFKRFGEVTDVYIPRPSRSFAFVTFLESSIVPSLYGDHFING